MLWRPLVALAALFHGDLVCGNLVETCEREGECAATEDASALLQMQTARRSISASALLSETFQISAESELSRQFSTAFHKSLLNETNLNGQGTFCVGQRVKPLDPAQTAEIPNTLDPVRTHLWWGNMEPEQPFKHLKELNSKLEPVTYPPEIPAEYTRLRVGEASAKEAIDIMFEATRVPGVIEYIPEKMRGVFWMKGNAVPEELAIMQYAHWSEEEQTLFVPTVPFNWAWPAGKPQNAPFGGVMYSENRTKGLTTSLFQTVPARGFSFKFGSPKLKDAYMQTGTFGDLTVAENTGNLIGLSLQLPPPYKYGFFNSAFTMKENWWSKKGNSWARGCYWGVDSLGDCAFLQFGSYELVKIMDGDGQPVEPYYNQFIEFMGTVKLMMWSGWKDEETKEGVRKDVEAAIKKR